MDKDSKSTRDRFGQGIELTRAELTTGLARHRVYQRNKVTSAKLMKMKSGRNTQWVDLTRDQV